MDVPCVQHAILARSAELVPILRRVILLEEMRQTGSLALAVDIADPIEVHPPTFITSRLFATRDDPVEVLQVWTQVESLQQRFS